MERSVPWLRSERAATVGDAVLIAGIFATGLAGHLAARTDAAVEAAPASLGVLVLAAVAAALLRWRRQHPLLVLTGVLVLAVVAGAGDRGGLYVLQLGLEVALLCFAIGAWSRRAVPASLVVTGLASLILVGAMGDGTGFWAAGAFALAVVGLPAMAGHAARVRRRYLEEVERRLVQAEIDRDERARVARADERARIARELHDVVAHHVSLIGVQAGAARTALDHSPEATRRALAAIEGSSRDAVGEMHRLLNALGPPPPGAPPQPGLGALVATIERWRDAGVAVEVHVDGDPSALSPALSLTAYRIVEEALTNVARHCAARRAQVQVSVDASHVAVSVRDPGPPMVGSNGTGRGLRGMAERVALFGGELRVGPVAAGGFAVEAELPLRQPPSA